MPKASTAINYFDDENQSQGLKDDFDATITAAEFMEFDWKGKAKRRQDGKSGNSLVLHLALTDDDGEEFDQYWSWGAIEDFVPTDDGTYFQPVGAKKPFKNNPGPILVRGFKGVKGFPKDLFDAMNVKALVGGKFHWNLVPQEGWKPGPNSEKTTPPDILTPTSMLEAPGGKSAKKPAPKKARVVEEEEEEEAETPAPKKGAKKAVVEEEDEEEAVEERGRAVEEDHDETALGLLKKALKSADENTLTLDEAATEVLSLMNKTKGFPPKNKKPVLALVGDPAWIKAQDGVTYSKKNGGTVALDE